MLNKSTYRVALDVDPYRFVLIVYLITVILFVLNARIRAIADRPYAPPEINI